MQTLRNKYLWLLLLCLFTTGCPDLNYPGNYRKTVLDIEIDLAGIPAIERNRIDTIEVSVSGVIELQEFTFDPTQDFSINGIAIIQTLDQEVGPIETSGDLFVRVSVLAGNVEIAADTQVIPIEVNSGHEDVKFALAIQPSPNGCRVYNPQKPVFDGVRVGTFGVSKANGNYFVAYVDKTNSTVETPRGQLYSVKLNTKGELLNGPFLLDSDVAPNIVSALPVVYGDLNGYVVAWERYEPSSGEKSVVLLRTEYNGSPTSLRRVIPVGKPTEVRPSIAVRQGAIAVGFGSKASANTPDQVTLASFDLFTLSPRATARELAPANYSSSYVSLAANGNGFGVLWSARASTTSEFQERFALLDQDLDVITQKILTNHEGTAMLGRLVSTSSNFLAAWEDTRDFEFEEQIALATISTDASTISEHFNVDPTFTRSANWPNIAMGNNGGVTAFYQFRDDENHAPQVFITRIAADGTKLGSGDLQISQNFAGEAGARFPDVVYAGTTTLNQTTPVDLYGLFWVEEHEGEVSRLMFATTYCKHDQYGDIE